MNIDVLLTDLERGQVMAEVSSGRQVEAVKRFEER